MARAYYASVTMIIVSWNSLEIVEKSHHWWSRVSPAVDNCLVRMKTYCELWKMNRSVQDQSCAILSDEIELENVVENNIGLFVVNKLKEITSPHQAKPICRASFFDRKNSYKQSNWKKNSKTIPIALG